VEDLQRQQQSVADSLIDKAVQRTNNNALLLEQRLKEKPTIHLLKLELKKHRLQVSGTKAQLTEQLLDCYSQVDNLLSESMSATLETEFPLVSVSLQGKLN